MHLFSGFLAGLSTGINCLGTCLPLFIPLLLADKQTTRSSFRLVIEFSLGRLFGYLLFGLLIGILGVTINNEIANQIINLSLLLSGIFLIIFSIGAIKWGHKACQLFFGKIKIPLVLGFLTGITPCPPFLASIPYIFTFKNLLSSLSYFFLFFLGTTLYIVPLGFLGLLSRQSLFQKIARLSGVIVGLYFIYSSLVLILKPSVKLLPSASNLSLSTQKEALFYERLEDNKVRCQLCPNRCLLSPGQRGLCKARENQDGKLITLVYGQPVAINLDPIEKKPFYHVLPGAKAYSLATAGCNLSCKFCQNWDISQRPPEELQSQSMAPQEVINEALKQKAEVIAFTYNEPTVWYEYMLDIAKEAKQKGLKTVMVSSGYINKEPLKKLIPFLDAVKVDLKGFNEKYYQEIVGGHLQPVLDALKTLSESNIHYEILNLLVPGKNDDPQEIQKMCSWIKQNLGDSVPMHFTRFYPMYKMQNLPPTPEGTVKNAREICLKQGLKYVYTGNIIDEEGSTTYCPETKEPLIIRKGFFVTQNLVDQNGQSKTCPSKIPGIWK